MPRRLAALVEHRVIAEMRIAVDHAEAAERKPPGREHRGGRGGCASSSGASLWASSLRALEPVEREQPAGRQLRPDVRHADQVSILSSIAR